MGPMMNKKKAKGKKIENECRNVFYFSKDGLKSCAGQDTHQAFGVDVDNLNIRFMGVYDGHGDKGKEASVFVETSTRKFVTENKAKIKKFSTATNSKQLITEMFQIVINIFTQLT